MDDSTYSRKLKSSLETRKELAEKIADWSTVEYTAKSDSWLSKEDAIDLGFDWNNYSEKVLQMKKP